MSRVSILVLVMAACASPILAIGEWSVRAEHDFNTDCGWFGHAVTKSTEADNSTSCAEACLESGPAECNAFTFGKDVTKPNAIGKCFQYVIEEDDLTRDKVFNTANIPVPKYECGLMVPGQAAEQCGAYPEAVNGHFVNPKAFFPPIPPTSSEPGTTITLVCQAGYIVEGALTSVCEEGEWTEPGTCVSSAIVPTSTARTPMPVGLDCGAVPTIRNGRIAQGPTTAPGTMRTVNCNPGYYVDGPSVVICQLDNAWSLPGRCRPVGQPPRIAYCSKVPTIRDGTVYLLGSVKSTGATALISCDPGHSVSGPALIVCQNDDDWSKPGICQSGSIMPVEPEPARCSDETPEIEHGRFFPGTNKIGSARRMVCDVGYQVVEPAFIFCTADGVWSNNGSCERIPPPSPVTRMCSNDTFFEKSHSFIGYLPTMDYIAGSEVHVSCRDRYELVGTNVITCQTNSRWSNSGACRRMRRYSVVDEDTVPSTNPLDLELIEHARKGNPHMVRSLINKGADVLAYVSVPFPSITGEVIDVTTSAIHVAAAYDHEDVVEELIKTDPRTTTIYDSAGRLAVHVASERGAVRSLEFLFRDPSCKNCDEARTGWNDQGTNPGSTPLILAAITGNEDSMEFLVPWGVDLFARDYHDKGAIHHAAELGFMRVVRYLVDKDDELTDMRGGNLFRSALMYASEAGQIAVVRFLEDYENLPKPF